MVRLWFNRTYATNWHVIRMIRGNAERRSVHVLGSHVDPYSPVLAACDRTLDEPELPPADYVEWALQIARTNEIDLFVPQQHMGVLAAARDRFAAIGTRLLCADEQVIAIFGDKAAGYRAAGALGVPVPPHRVVHDGAELRDAYAEFAAIAEQVCMKPVRGVGGEGYRRLTTDPVRWEGELDGPVRSLVRLDDACRALDAGTPREVMVMPFLDGPEVSVDVLADADGRVHAAIGRRHCTGSRLRTIVDDAPARHIAETLTGAHRVAYLSNTQVRYWHDRPYLLELNTRAAGGLFQSALAGVNLAWAAVRLGLGEQPDEPRPRFGASYTAIADLVELQVSE